MRRRRVVIAATVCACVFVTGALAAWQVLSGSKPVYSAHDYPRLYKDGGWALYGLPASLPIAASEVRILAPAARRSPIPSPDQYVEVRLVLPIAEARALLGAEQARTRVDESKAGDASTISERLLTADDRDSGTPLPEGFQTVVLTNPSGMNLGGVSIHTETGEVVYWIFEF